jgi:hypothetical protein
MKCLWVLFLLTLSCAGAWGQCKSFWTQQTSNPLIGPQFFGQGYLTLPTTSMPMQISEYGTNRQFATEGNKPTMWFVLNTALNTYHWQNIDDRLAELAQMEPNVTCVLYVLYGTPEWDAPPTPDGCEDETGHDHQCLAPLDISSTGSTNGQDSSVYKFMVAMEQRVHDPNYLNGTGGYSQKHAYIGMIEVWNEISASHILGPMWNPCGETNEQHCYWDGTYDQMRRMAEDVRCAWTGKGTIHKAGFTPGNPVSNCTSTPYTKDTIIGSPSIVSQNDDNRSVLCNFLYGDPLIPGTLNHLCQKFTGSGPKAGSNPSGDFPNNPGSGMIDAVLFHPYGGNPETIYLTDVPKILEFLQSNEKTNKYLMASEWGADDPPGPPGYTLDGQIADLPRRTLALLANGVSLSVMWEYDSSTQGTEISPPGTLCLGETFLTCLGVAHIAVYNWLANKTFTGCDSGAGGGVIRCNLTGSNGYQAQIAWWCGDNSTSLCASDDSTLIRNLGCGGTFNNPQCGITPYTPPHYATQWRDLGGGTTTCGTLGCGGLKIGQKPIIVESGPGN